jgi:D-glycero-D-manno-heptose 1,7-bisphosphate phosphatase
MYIWSVKALFLDRDGVINFDPGDYTKSLAEFELLPHFLEHAKTWYDSGYLLIVITNQGGIAKGLYSAQAVQAMHQYLQGKCIEAGFRIAAFYFCPHHENYSGRCLCRKPGSLMVEKALHKFRLDPKQCYFIGDKERDMHCAEMAEVKGIKINENQPFPKYDEVNLA